MGMMGKIKETQKKVEATKERLNTVMIDEVSTDGSVKVTLTANREIKSISIDDSLLEDKEQLEDYLVLTLNKAIDKVQKDVSRTEGKLSNEKFVSNAPEAVIAKERAKLEDGQKQLEKLHVKVETIQSL